MFATVHSASNLGMDGYPVRVEVDVSPGLPNFQIVGLPDAAIKESRDRVRAAVKNSGFQFPLSRVTVNLSPADIRKAGPSFDLPIALGLLACTGALAPERLAGRCTLGELSLDGLLRPVSGVLPAAECAMQRGYEALVLPAKNAPEAALIDGLVLLPCRTLSEAVYALEDGLTSPAQVPDAWRCSEESGPADDFADVRGQEHVKRALEICAAGMHNALMVGPPGSGKTMLARRLPGIMPPMTREESITVTKIYSVAGLLGSHPLITGRPFRSPHHTISNVGLAGGGSGVPQPGEVSLSHCGVLFMDELPEFGRRCLEVLRQPLEDGRVTISRSLTSVTYPAGFMLVAAMNPCPCGYSGDGRRRCTCNAGNAARYMQRLSGPLLDRIDVQVHVPRLSKKEMRSRSVGTGSAEMRSRIALARKRQVDRQRHCGDALFNSRISAARLRELSLALTEEAAAFLSEAVERLDMSARAHDRSLKIALTIADLEESESIEVRHIAEAIQYRGLDRVLNR